MCLRVSSCAYVYSFHRFEGDYHPSALPHNILGWKKGEPFENEPRGVTWILLHIYIYIFIHHTASLCNTPQHTSTHRTSTHRNTLQQTATHCKTLQPIISFHSNTAIWNSKYLSIWHPWSARFWARRNIFRTHTPAHTHIFTHAHTLGAGRIIFPFFEEIFVHTWAEFTRIETTVWICEGSWKILRMSDVTYEWVLPSV